MSSPARLRSSPQNGTTLPSADAAEIEQSGEDAWLQEEVLWDPRAGDRATWLRRALFTYCVSFGFWMPFAALLTWQQYRIMWQSQLVHVPVTVIAVLVFARYIAVALLTPPIFHIVEGAVITSIAFVRRTVLYLMGFFPFLLTVAVIRWILTPSWSAQERHWGPRSFDSLLTFMHTTFADELVIYLAIVIASHAAIYYKRLQRQDLEKLALREALTRNELQALQMQVQPHFLFNTLNGIAALLHSDATRAESMVLRLSSLLRHTLKQDCTDLCPLSEELWIVDDYLEIEAMRLGERMTVRTSVDPDTRHLLVPHFMFQMLVENAVKHGIAGCRGPGWIEVACQRRGSRLDLEVRNSFSGETRKGMGVGHQNIRNRLKLLYGEEAKLHFECRSDSAIARLELPALPAQHSRRSAGVQSDGQNE